MVAQSLEAEDFLEAVGDVGSGAIGSCDGWTAHGVAAHVTAIEVEVIALDWNGSARASFGTLVKPAASASAGFGEWGVWDPPLTEVETAPLLLRFCQEIYDLVMVPRDTALRLLDWNEVNFGPMNGPHFARKRQHEQWSVGLGQFCVARGRHLGHCRCGKTTRSGTSTEMEGTLDSWHDWRMVPARNHRSNRFCLLFGRRSEAITRP